MASEYPRVVLRSPNPEDIGNFEFRRKIHPSSSYGPWTPMPVNGTFPGGSADCHDLTYRDVLEFRSSVPYDIAAFTTILKHSVNWSYYCRIRRKNVQPDSNIGFFINPRMNSSPSHPQVYSGRRPGLVQNEDLSDTEWVVSIAGTGSNLSNVQTSNSFQMFFNQRYPPTPPLPPPRPVVSFNNAHIKFSYMDKE